jgi:hypothetical protein
MNGRRSISWDALLDRFERFVAMPCLTGSGPETRRKRKAAALRRKVEGQLDEAREKRLLPTRPVALTERHVRLMLKSMRSAGRAPSHSALWNGLWRAIILDRDDYRCYFCSRSGEVGIKVRDFRRPLALRLQLDHIVPRSHGGHDYRLSNIRRTCASAIRSVSDSRRAISVPNWSRLLSP